MSISKDILETLSEVRRNDRPRSELAAFVAAAALKIGRIMEVGVCNAALMLWYRDGAAVAAGYCPAVTFDVGLTDEARATCGNLVAFAEQMRLLTSADHCVLAFSDGTTDAPLDGKRPTFYGCNASVGDEFDVMVMSGCDRPRDWLHACAIGKDAIISKALAEGRRAAEACCAITALEHGAASAESIPHFFEAVVLGALEENRDLMLIDLRNNPPDGEPFWAMIHQYRRQTHGSPEPDQFPI